MKTIPKPLRLLAATLVASALALPLPVLAASDSAATGTNMGMSTDAPVMPAVHGFLDGQPMLFMHTAVSDSGVAKILTDMMGGSPVLTIPALAKSPAEMVTPVYAFTNGYSGTGPMGPLGGQPDIFATAPGDAGYSPLHQIVVVTWNPGATIVALKSYPALQAKIASGDISAKATAIIANMPFLTWPGGSR